MGMRRTLGWVNTMSMHHDWLHSSIMITLVHLITFVGFTFPAWTSMLVYQHHDFTAVRSMHPWRWGDVRGTLKFQYSDSVTLCNHPPKKSHQVAAPIDHSVCVTYCLPLPHHSPFYFCALLLSSYSISIYFTYYFKYFLYFIFSPYLPSMIRCWLLCTLSLM